MRVCMATSACQGGPLACNTQLSAHRQACLGHVLVKAKVELFYPVAFLVVPLAECYVNWTATVERRDLSHR